MVKITLIILLLLTLLLPTMIIPTGQKNPPLLQVKITPLRPPNYQEVMRIERNKVRLLSGFSESFAFSPDGLQIAAAASETTVSIWDVKTGDILRTFEQNATYVSWSPDGAFLTTSSYQDAIRLWESQTGLLLYELDNRSWGYIGWSPDSTRFVTSDLKTFDARTGQPVSGVNSDVFASQEIHWSPDGTMLVTTFGWEDHYMNLWSATGEHLDTYWGGKSASWNPASTRIASTGEIRDVLTGLPVVIIPQMDHDIAWHPGGKWIASTGDAGKIFLWDAATGDLAKMWQYEDCVTDGFTWSSDGERFAVNCIQSQPEYHNDLMIWEHGSEVKAP